MDERRRGAEENKSGYPSGMQPSCHEWEDLEYGVLALPETFGGWIWGGGCIDRVSSLALLAREHRGKQILMTSIVSLRK